MKKLMFTAAVAAGLAAFGTGIESANTVGYNTKELTAGKFAILGVQFTGMDETININNVVSGLTGVSQDELEDAFVASAPQIQVPNSKGTYDIYYYLVDAWYDNGTEDGAYKPGWCDLNGVIAGDGESVLDGMLTPGVAMWVKDVSASETFQQAGQVPSDASVQVSAPATFALRANAFPVTFNLNDSSKVTFSGLAQVTQEDHEDDFVDYASQIQVPNSKGTYDIYYYLLDGWYDNGTEDGAYKPGWCDLNGVIAGDEESVLSGDVPAGQGFWTKGVSGTFTMTFVK